MWFSSCAENASSPLITGNHLYLILAQHLPKLPALIQEETQITAGFSSRQNLDAAQEGKNLPVLQFGPRLLHIYINSRGQKKKEGRSSPCASARKQTN